MERPTLTPGLRAALLLILASASLYLLSANLGNQYLWEDEAQTALIGRTVLSGGVPRGHDGRNSFSQVGGAELGRERIWRWHAWLPFYVVAAFYKAFGVSTAVSRAPFVLFGFATILLSYFFCRALWPRTRIPEIAAALLSVSVPFLLLARQCRYYSMVMFFTLLALYAYAALRERRRFAVPALFAAATLLFHSQHSYLAPLFLALFLHAAVFRRDLLKPLAAAAAAVALCNGPWLFWFAGMGELVPRPLSDKLSGIAAFLQDIARYLFPLWLFAVAAVALAITGHRAGRLPRPARDFWEKWSLPAFFVAANVVALPLMNADHYFRYLAPSIPLLAILAAGVVHAAGRAHPLLAVLAAAGLLAGGQLKDYLYEISHDYDGPGEGISRHLNRHGRPGDVVAITYGDLVLKLYTDFRIVGGLTGEPLLGAENARWVIIRKHIHLPMDRAVGDYLLGRVDWRRYRRVVIDYPDTPWENREDPESHLFRTQAREDRVVLYERM